MRHADGAGRAQRLRGKRALEAKETERIRGQISITDTLVAQRRDKLAAVEREVREARADRGVHDTRLDELRGKGRAQMEEIEGLSIGRLACTHALRGSFRTVRNSRRARRSCQAGWSPSTPC